MAKEMNSRERVMATLNRQPTDRMALDIGGTDCSSIHVHTYHKLRKLLGLADGPIEAGCLIQLVAAQSDEVADALDTDVEALWFGSQDTKIWHAPFGLDLVVPTKFDVEDRADGSSVVRNTKGEVTFLRAADCMYFDPVAPPLAHIQSPEELEAWDALFERWDYSYIYDEPLSDLAVRAKRQYESTDRAVVSLWRMHYLQAGLYQRGFEQFMMDLIEDRDLVVALMERTHAAYMKRAKLFLDAFGDFVDAVFLTDDLGTQQGGLISTEAYKQLIFPYVAELVRTIKAAGKKVIMHSCGSVPKFIPYLIEMGVDALNPVQVSAHGMNPADLVRQFGQDIAFWGGGCDTQHALNSPDPEVVRADVRRRLQEFGPDAHLVFTQVHNVQYDVAPENVLAMQDEFVKQTRG